MDHLEAGRGELIKWESQRSVTILDDFALGGPVGPDDVGIQPCHDGVDLRADAVELIAPDRENAFRSDDAAHLGVKSRQVDPVQCLGDRQQIDRTIVDRQFVGGGDLVANLRVGLGLIDLLSAGVGRDDAAEMRRQRHGRLAIAGCTVACEVMR